MNSVVETFHGLFHSAIPFYPKLVENCCQEIDELSAAELPAIVNGFCQSLEGKPNAYHEEIRQMYIRAVLARFSVRIAKLSVGESGKLSAKGRVKVISTDLLKKFYLLLPENFRGVALQMLAVQSQPDDLEVMVEMLVNQPPTTAEGLLVGLAPLFQIPDWNIDAFFPSVLGAIEHQHIAAGLLDLANHAMTSRKLKKHPCYSRRKDLIELLGAIVRRLEQFEEDPRSFGSEVKVIQDTLREAISLAVSLCYCAGLMGDAAAIGKLNQASELMHRRIQAEAFGALARLGEDHGRKELIALAKEPSARLRVISYAKELGLDDLIAPRFLTEESLAEARLALWLSEPNNYSVPPTKLELIDHRELYWPGFQEAQDVYLFRFHYEMGASTVSNIGISGPMTYAFGADLADLPIEDIYAAFAGWHMEHPEVRDFPYEQLKEIASYNIKPLIKRLRDAGHSKLKHVTIGMFFGEHVLVSNTNRGKLQGVAVTTINDLLWFPTTSRLRPLTAREAYSIFKGRIILKSFNEALGNAWRQQDDMPELAEEDESEE